MEKSFTLKTDDKGLSLEDALLCFGEGSYQGTFKKYAIRVYGGTSLYKKVYWYALKDNEVYCDRGLTGLLDFIESRQTPEISV